MNLAEITSPPDEANPETDKKGLLIETGGYVNSEHAVACIPKGQIGIASRKRRVDLGREGEEAGGAGSADDSLTTHTRTMSAARRGSSLMLGRPAGRPGHR